MFYGNNLSYFHGARMVFNYIINYLYTPEKGCVGLNKWITMRKLSQIKQSGFQYTSVNICNVLNVVDFETQYVRNGWNWW